MFPETIAVYFHIRHGCKWISPGDLRRTAALLFTADPTLAQLHPVHRLACEFCPSNRILSCLAQGMTAEDAKASVARSMYQVDTASSEAHSSELIRAILLGEDGSSLRLAHGETPRMPQIPTWPLTVLRGIIDCVNELLSASRRGVISTLMQSERIGARLAYNFQNFGESRFGDEEHKRTIEFRQGAGTLDADEIVAFARLWVGLCEFVSQAPFGNVWPAIYRCAVADMADGEVRFDVFDLLANTSLVEEAEALQKIIVTKGDPVPPRS